MTNNNDLEELLKRERKPEDLEEILKRKKRENIRPKKESVNPTDYTVYDYSPPVDILKLNKKRKKGFEFPSFNFNYKPVKDVCVNTIDSVMDNCWNMGGPILSGVIIGAIGVGLYLLSTSYIEDYKSKDKSVPLSQSSVSSQQNPISNPVSTVYDITTNSVSNAVDTLLKSVTSIVKEEKKTNAPLEKKYETQKGNDEKPIKYINKNQENQMESMQKEYETQSYQDIVKEQEKIMQRMQKEYETQMKNMRPTNIPGKIEYNKSVFMVYDTNGNWMFSRNIADNGAGPYGQSNDFNVVKAKLGDFDGDGENEIVVIGNHKSSYSGQVTIWETNGDFNGRYWNSGHLKSLLTYDIDKDGKEEIIVGGVYTKDGNYAPSLFALDEENVVSGGVKWYHYVGTDFDSKGITSLKIRNEKIIGDSNEDYNKLKLCITLDGKPTKCD